ncbi:hypothetical protein ACTXT7_010318 [Hymenolepis weldensis]
MNKPPRRNTGTTGELQENPKKNFSYLYTIQKVAFYVKGHLRIFLVAPRATFVQILLTDHKEGKVL